MEIDEVMSDLLALRELYGLLQNVGYGFGNKSPENLDEHARLLLKNLLDIATERFFETHSKIIAAQSSVSKTPFPSELPKAVVLKSNSPVLPDNLKAFPSITRNSSVDSKCETVTSQKDERLHKKPTFEGLASELYRPDKPVYRKERCRNCGRPRMKPQRTSPNKDGNPRDGEHLNHVSPLDGDNGQAKGSPEVEVKSVESVLRSNENPIGQPNKAHQLQSCHRRTVSSSSNLASGEIETGVEIASPTGKIPGEASDFSGDVNNAVKRIESHISALQQYCSQTLESTKTCAAWGGIPKSETSLMLSKEGLATRSELSFGCEKVELGRQASGVGRKHNVTLSSAQQLRLLRQNTKPIESPSRSDDASSQIGDYVLGFGLPTTLGLDDYFSKRPPSMAMSPTTMNANRGSTTLSPAQKLQLLRQNAKKPIESPSQIGDYVHGFGVPTTLGRDDYFPKRPPSLVMSPTTMNAKSQRVGSTGSSVGHGGQTQRPSSRSQIREKKLPHRIAIKPTLLDHESSETKQVHRDRRRGTFPHEKMTHKGLQREISPLQWNEESHYSSASYLSSSSCSSSRSLPSQIRSTYFSSSSSSSLPSQRRGHHHIGTTSARLTRRRTSEASSSELEESFPEESSSELEESFSEESASGSSVPYSTRERTHYRDADPPSRRIGVSRTTYRSDRRKNPGNAIGRFKNKLGLIFHHHHHHHHHHHDGGDHHNQSLWRKSSQKVFQRSNNLHGPKVKKVNNNAARRKHQVGHFHALVEGLLRHVRHSKKSKPSRGGLVGLGENGTRGKKGGAKKLQWWKMFRRHGGVKIPKRRRVRSVGGGYLKKKPLLKMS